MFIELPQRLRRDIDDAVRSAFVRNRIVNVSGIAAAVQRRHWSLNVAREDIERRALETSTLVGAVVLFDSSRDDGLSFESLVSEGSQATH